jgi:hypothetical protein
LTVDGTTKVDRLMATTVTDTTDETNPGLLIGRNTTTGDQILYSGINKAGTYSYIGAARVGVAYNELRLNPNGGLTTHYARVAHPTVTTLSSRDATPSVSLGNLFKTGDTTTITDFDDGVVGQTIHILAAHAKTITHSTRNILLHGSTNFVMAVDDTLTLIMFLDGKWHELSRMVA